MLTYRQKRVLTEYGYLLSKENAEQVGAMLGGFKGREEIARFVEQYGEKVEQ